MQFDEEFVEDALNATKVKPITKSEMNVHVPIFDAQSDGNLRMKASHGLGASPYNDASQRALSKGMMGKGGPLSWFPLNQSEASLYNPSYVDFTTQVPNVKSGGKMNTNGYRTSKSAPLTFCERV